MDPFEFETLQVAHQEGRMPGDGGSSPSRSPMPTEDQAKYNSVRQQIDKLSGQIRFICPRIKAVGPNPPAGSFARLPGGMGSIHLGGVQCDLDTHNPGKGGNSWLLCRKSHTHYGSQHQTSQDAIDDTLENSVEGNVACARVSCCCVSSLLLRQIVS